MLLADLISDRGIRLLIITTVLSHFPNLLDMPFSLLFHFLPVLTPETSFCSILKFCPVVHKIVFSITEKFQQGHFFSF